MRIGDTVVVTGVPALLTGCAVWTEGPPGLTIIIGLVVISVLEPFAWAPDAVG